VTVIVYPTAATLARATAVRFLTEVTDALALRGVAHVVLTGGRIGTAVLDEVAASPLRDDVDWTSLHVWWGDERFVPEGDPDRNEGQAQRALLGRVRLPEENIHRMAAASPGVTPQDGAVRYAEELARFGDPCPTFDVLLLGLGDDGHVASIFPGETRVEGNAESSVIAVEGSPKPPATRISLTLATINRARQVWIVAAGHDKAAAVSRCLAKDPSLPGARVAGTERTLWLVDAAAAAEA
jgi:6-phosphogluconolactonase